MLITVWDHSYHFAKNLFSGQWTKGTRIKAIIPVVSHHKVLPGTKLDGWDIPILVLSRRVGCPMTVLHHDRRTYLVRRRYPAEIDVIQQLNRQGESIDYDAILSHFNRFARQPKNALDINSGTAGKMRLD